MERFSKKTIKRYIDKKMQRYEREFGFDPNNGYVQVRGKGEPINIAYGEYNQLQQLMYEFNLYDVTYE